MPRQLIILGAGGGAGDVLDAAEAQRQAWQIMGFLDDTHPVGSTHMGYPVLGRLADAALFRGAFFINAIGSDKSHKGRPGLIARTGLERTHFATLVHPGACVSSRAEIGQGIFIGYGVCVSAGVHIGDHVSLSPRALIGHDSMIASHAMVAPGAIVSGFVHIGTAAYIGAGAMIRQRVGVGERALVGMGAVVLGDVPAEMTVAGNPARILVPRGQAAMPSLHALAGE